MNEGFYGLFWRGCDLVLNDQNGSGGMLCHGNVRAVHHGYRKKSENGRTGWRKMRGNSSMRYWIKIFVGGRSEMCRTDM